MYERMITSVKTTRRETSKFTITVGLHQGSSLSLYLFVLVIDELTKRNRKKHHGIYYLLMMLY